MGIAFFDLDKTLIAVNSAVLWVRAERKTGNITRWQALRAGLWLLCYNFGAADFEDALRMSIATLAGTREHDMRTRAERFWKREVSATVRPGALAAIAQHRQAGDRLVLLTSSSLYMSDPVVRELSLHDALCTRLEVDANGCFTGKPIEPLCFGRGKLQIAERYAQAIGASLEDCIFYSDSASDAPTLLAVGKAVAVNPDPRLRRLARAQGWQIADWGAASPSTEQQQQPAR